MKPIQYRRRILFWTSFACLFLFIHVISGCKQDSPSNERQEAVEREISDPDSILVHLVFLTLREDMEESEKAELIKQIQSMDTIPFIASLDVGTKAQTGDPRMLPGADIIFHMTFHSRDELDRYAKHPTHIDLRERTKEYMAAPPVVYDYWK